MFKTNQKGFTLIELLVVIAIIGILSSVVLASLNTARQKSRDARRISDIKQLQLALELHYDAQGQYPSDISESTLVDPGYIAAIPLDPSDDDKYSYAVSGDQTDYHIGTSLEQSTHQSLGSDVDYDSSTWTNGFDGGATIDDSQDGTGAPCYTDDTGVACYDMKP